jgi:phosphatidylinositol alpha-1,6-mannosyltransferase
LDPDRFAVLTTATEGSDEFDASQRFRIRRVKGPMLPIPELRRRIEREMAESGAERLVIDPTLPLGSIIPGIGVPYAVLIHGAELLVPMALPGLRAETRRILGGAQAVISSGSDAADEARALIGEAPGAPSKVHVVFPGVDLDYFRPLGAAEREQVRASLGYDPDETVVLFVSRLVPRKGADMVIRGLGEIGRATPSLRVVIGGEGRDRARLERIAREEGVRCEFVGGLSKSALRAHYQSCDLFAMLCRDRWFGMEREGFGIVFLEAQACGAPVVVGRSGGSIDALDTSTGVLVEDPNDIGSVRAAFASMLDEGAPRVRFGEAPRRFVEQEFDYEDLAAKLSLILTSFGA